MIGLFCMTTMLSVVIGLSIATIYHASPDNFPVAISLSVLVCIFYSIVFFRKNKKPQ